MGNIKAHNSILTQTFMPALGVSETFFCKIFGFSYEKQEKEEVEVVTCRYCVYENLLHQNSTSAAILSLRCLVY